jgi:hypothetical protein
MKTNYHSAVILLKREGIQYNIPRHGVIHVEHKQNIGKLIDFLLLREQIMDLGATLSDTEESTDFIFGNMTPEMELNQRAKRVVGEAIANGRAGKMIGIRYEREHIAHLEVSAKRSPYHGTMLGTNVKRIDKIRQKYGSKEHVLFVYVVASLRAVYTIKAEAYYHAIDTHVAQIHAHRGKNIWMLPISYFNEEFEISDDEFKDLRNLHDVVKRMDDNQKGLFNDD